MPEIICYKRRMAWMVAVELPEELVPDVLAVYQAGVPLERDQWRENAWVLKSTEEVTIELRESGHDIRTRVTLPGQAYILLKLVSDEGRAAKNLSAGTYLVAAPEAWDRDLSATAPPVMPEPCSIGGYRAHFYFVSADDDDAGIVFRKPMGESVSVVRSGSIFELDGQVFAGDLDSLPPLFLGGAPQLVLTEAAIALDVRTMVIGEEKSTSRRFRISLSLQPGISLHDLDKVLHQRSGGQYFLRLYDSDDRLVDSMGFRFVRGLHKIEVDQPPALPTRDGHSPVKVRFYHKEDCHVDPANPVPALPALEKCKHGTTILVPARSDLDCTRWRVRFAHGHVELTIRTHRIWWAVSTTDCCPSTWQDRIVTLDPSDFAANSKKALWLKLPSDRLLGCVCVGFGEVHARRYRVSKTSNVLSVPFREYCDTPEARTPTTQPVLCIWLGDVRQSSSKETGAVARIQPPPLPKPTPPNPPALPPRPRDIERFTTDRFVRRFVLADGRRIADLQACLVAAAKEDSRRCRLFIDLERNLRTLRIQHDQSWIIWLALCAVDDVRARPRWLDDLILPEVARRDLALAKAELVRWLQQTNSAGRGPRSH